MPDWASEFLTGGISQGLMVPWNWCMYAVYQLFGYSFPDLSPSESGQTFWQKMGELLGFQVHSAAGLYSLQDIYNWFLSAGLVLLNLFCMIAFCRQASRLRENVTTEMWIELFIKVIVGNVLMLEGLKIMLSFLGVAATTSNLMLENSRVDIVSSNVDFGAVLGYILIGIIFVIASIVCGIMILVTLLQRIINIYLLACVMPIACSTLAGGPEIERSGWAWFKTFLGSCFEIVVIALVFLLGGAFNDALQGWAVGNSDGWFDGFLGLLASMTYMIFLTVCVKGAGGFLRKAFDLR